jgi:hypothetical protein
MKLLGWRLLGSQITICSNERLKTLRCLCVFFFSFFSFKTRSHFVAQAGLKFASTSQVLVLEMCVTTPSFLSMSSPCSPSLCLLTLEISQIEDASTQKWKELQIRLPLSPSCFSRGWWRTCHSLRLTLKVCCICRRAAAITLRTA